MRFDEFVITEKYSTEQYKTLLSVLSFARQRSEETGGDGSIHINAVSKMMQTSGFQFNDEIFTQMQQEFPELQHISLDGDRMMLDPEAKPTDDLDDLGDIDTDIDSDLDDFDLDDLGGIDDGEEDDRPDFEDEPETDTDVSTSVDKNVVTKMARSASSI